MPRHQRRPWRASPAAEADLVRLGGDDSRLPRRAVALIELVADGRVEGVALQLMASYGDLRDCRKVYFGLTDEPTHRIVYRLLTNRSIEIIEVVAVEQREEGYVYLLAAQRLGRLPSESKKRFDRTHQTVISRRGRSRRS